MWKIFGTAVWVAGAVLAKGFWWTAFAIVCPFYGWYLVVSKLLHIVGWI